MSAILVHRAKGAEPNQGYACDISSAMPRIGLSRTFKRSLEYNYIKIGVGIDHIDFDQFV